jgi:hypothetical protein
MIIKWLVIKVAISIGQLYIAGCIASFDAQSITITHRNRTVITSRTRSPQTRLWHISLPAAHVLAPFPVHHEPPNHVSPNNRANATSLSTNPAKLLAFAHTALFSPVLSTLCTALDQNLFTGFPALTSALVRKHPPRPVFRIKGHLD